MLCLCWLIMPFTWLQCMSCPALYRFEFCLQAWSQQMPTQEMHTPCLASWSKHGHKPSKVPC